MATLLITNISSSPVYITDIYKELAVGASVSAIRPMSALPEMSSLQKLLAAGKVTLTVTPSADETASGLASPPNVIGADDILAVASTGSIAPDITIRKLVAAGAGGSADDVTVYAANALPFKFRIMDAWAYVAAGAAGGRTITVRDEAAGAGTSAGTLDAAATGRVNLAPASNASVVYTPGASKGLFLRRSDSAVGGEVFVRVRRES